MRPVAAPLVVCLACRADDQPRRVEEVAALALALGGKAEVHEVSGRTTALSVSVPEDVAARFTAAMALSGALILGAAESAAPADLLILITAETAIPSTE